MRCIPTILVAGLALLGGVDAGNPRQRTGSGNGSNSGSNAKLSEFHDCMGNRTVPSKDYFTTESPMYEEFALGPKARILRKPAAVYLAKNEDDVVAAVKCAYKSKLTTVPRSGGHSYEVLSSLDNALVIDLAEMNAVKVTEKKDDYALATIEGGARLGQVYIELDRQGGYNFNAGTCQGVGIGGHISGGGYGMTSRHYGLAADRTVAMRVVLYNGTVVEANENANSDLYWALRGGGAGSFGIITEFTVKAFKFEKSTMFTLKYDVNVTVPLLRTWMSYFSNATTRVTTQFNLNQKDATIVGQYLGPVDELTELLEESGVMAFNGSLLHSFKSDECTNLATKSYMWAGNCSEDQIKLLDVAKHPPSKERDVSKIKSGYGSKILPEEAIEMILENMKNVPSWTWMQFEAYGGTFPTKSEDYTPWMHRNVLFSVQYAVGLEPGEAESSKQYDWIRAFEKDLQPYLNGHSYQNYCDLDFKTNYGEVYWGKANYARLQQIKARYDPNDFFKNPQSIQLPNNSPRQQHL